MAVEVIHATLLQLRNGWFADEVSLAQTVPYIEKNSMAMPTLKISLFDISTFLNGLPRHRCHLLDVTSDMTNRSQIGAPVLDHVKNE